MNTYFTNFIEKVNIIIIKNLKSEILGILLGIISNTTGNTGVYPGEYPDYGFWNSLDEFFHTETLTFR